MESQFATGIGISMGKRKAGNDDVTLDDRSQDPRISRIVTPHDSRHKWNDAKRVIMTQRCTIRRVPSSASLLIEAQDHEMPVQI
jgi:hypothetical protein